MVHQRYGDVSYAAVEVQFGDGRSELFCHHELKEVKSSNSDPGESRDSLWGGDGGLSASDARSLPSQPPTRLYTRADRGT